jgi:hypothetical protein
MDPEGSHRIGFKVKKEFLHFLAEKLQPTTYKKHSR